MTVQNPHDKFFRESFSRVEVVRNFLQEYLPAERVRCFGRKPTAMLYSLPEGFT